MNNVVFSGNNCYGTDPSGDPQKVFKPSCQLKVCFATNVTVSGNAIRGPAAVSFIDIVNSTNVIVNGNVVDKASSQTDSLEKCYSLGRLANATFSDNTCLNTGGDVFYIWGDSGQVHDLSFVNNTLFTTTSTALAVNFFNFVVNAADVSIRENRMFGKNLVGGPSSQERSRA